MLSVESLLAYGPLGLFLVAFTESTIFPIPPDVILLPLAMMSPRLSWWYAFLTSSASVLGALVGYAVGRKAGRPVLKRFFKEDTIQQVETLFVKYGGWAVGIAAFTPIPFKVFTFGAGIFRVPLLTFTVVSTVGRSARFFLEAAMVYFLGDKAQAYLGRNFELATLGLTAVLLLITWLLPKMIPSAKKSSAPDAPRTSRIAAIYLRAVRQTRALGPRFLAWASSSAVVGIFGAAFLEDVAGAERDALIAALGPAFAWFSWARPASAFWGVLSSPWVLCPLALAGFWAYLGPIRRPLPAVVVGLAALGWGVERGIRMYLRGTYGSATASGAPLVLAPCLLALGIYLLDYRRATWWRKVGLLPAGVGAAVLAARAVLDGRLDPASAATSLIASFFMLCVTMTALSALSALYVVSAPSAPKR